MARMHTRRRGKSASTRPFRTESPDWVPLDRKEIEEAVVELAKGGASTAKIGIVLRDQFGIPSVKLALGKSVSQVLRANDLLPEIPDELRNLMKRAVNLSDHLTKNPRDLHNTRNLHLIEAKIRRLVKYYQKTGRMAKDWKYSLENAKLLVE
jgi:small subunit ribosomal protein S15